VRVLGINYMDEHQALSAPRASIALSEMRPRPPRDAGAMPGVWNGDGSEIDDRDVRWRLETIAFLKKNLEP
jgi:hypothetical protein